LSAPLAVSNIFPGGMEELGEAALEASGKAVA
jgi:hypothetical protein